MISCPLRPSSIRGPPIPRPPRGRGPRTTLTCAPSSLSGGALSDASGRPVHVGRDQPRKAGCTGGRPAYACGTGGTAVTMGRPASAGKQRPPVRSLEGRVMLFGRKGPVVEQSRPLGGLPPPSHLGRPRGRRGPAQVSDLRRAVPRHGRLQLLADERYRVNPENGNLVQRWLALPFLLSRPQFPSLDQEKWRHPTAAGEDLPTSSSTTAATTRTACSAARAMTVVLGVALGWVVYRWSRRLFGRRGGSSHCPVHVLPHLNGPRGPRDDGRGGGPVFSLARRRSVGRPAPR